MVVLSAKTLTLLDVEQRFKFNKLPNGLLTSFLKLEPLTDYEQQELAQIRSDFDPYFREGKLSEGLIKAFTTFPLMRLAGFYRLPIKISVEQDIADIETEDEGTVIKGRLDILAINKNPQVTASPYFWILVIESKNSTVAPSAGLPQLLTYAIQGLEHQSTIWGLSTSGELYQFVRIQRGNPSTYQLMPVLGLMDIEPSVQILQALKAIRQL